MMQHGKITWLVIMMLILLGGLQQGKVFAQAGEGNMVELTTFGVKRDGVTDDTAALQAALKSLKSGQTLHIPVGTYKISTINMPAGVTLVGDVGTVIKGGGGGAEIINISTDHVTLKNLIIDGDMKRKTAVKNDNANYTTLEKCEIRNTSGDTTMGSWAVWLKGGSNIAIKNCQIHDVSGPKNGKNGDNIGANRAVVAWNVKKVSILNCVFSKVSGFEDGDCIQITGDSNWISDATIQECTFSDFYKRAVKVQVSGVKVINNTMVANQTANNSATGKQFQAAISVLAKNTLVQGNMITLYHSTQGIGVEGANCKIIGNTVIVDKTGSNYSTAGIYLSSDGSGGIIKNNIVKNIPAPNGIDFRTAKNVISINNIIK
ncbi:glycosyl hydrolase family 28-related protein [Azotosporobacter soli]|uniref:glycosyl hydrolase family 28-related protein n=1 Tax=Azotosporobacter soli TaxID=3055040 RepID=UPI0031FE6BE0